MQHLAEDTSSPFANSAELVPYTAFETEAGGGGVGGSRHAGALQDALWPSNLRENETQLGLPGGVELRLDHLDPELLDTLGRLYIVADGVTHCADGTTAARLAAQIIGQEYYQAPGRSPAAPELWGRRLAAGFERAHERLQAWQERWYCAYYFKHNDQQPKHWRHQQVNWRDGQPRCPLCGERLRGLLSTAVAVVVGESRGNSVAVVAGVGDSPAYRLPPDAGATLHPIYSPRAKEFLGSPGRLQVYAQPPLPIYPGEWLLLGSDGVFSALSGRYGSAWPTALRQRLTAGRDQGLAGELYGAVPELVRELGQWGAERDNAAWHDDQALIVVSVRAAAESMGNGRRSLGASTNAYVAPPALTRPDPYVPPRYTTPGSSRPDSWPGPAGRSYDTGPLYNDNAANDTYDRSADTHTPSSVTLPPAHAGVRRRPSLRWPRLALPRRPGVKRVLFGLLIAGLVAALFLLNRDRGNRDAATSAAIEAAARNQMAQVAASTPSTAALAALPPTATPTGIPTSTPAVAALVNPTNALPPTATSTAIPTSTPAVAAQAPPPTATGNAAADLSKSTASAGTIPTTTPVPGSSLPPLPLVYGPNVMLDVPPGGSYEAALQTAFGLSGDPAAAEVAAAVAAFGLPQPPQAEAYPGFLPPVPYHYLFVGQLDSFSAISRPQELILRPIYDSGVQLRLSLTDVSNQELLQLATWVDDGQSVWLLATSPVLEAAIFECRQAKLPGECRLSQLLGQSNSELLLTSAVVMGIDGDGALTPLDVPSTGGHGWIFADLGPDGIGPALSGAQRDAVGERAGQFSLLQGQWNGGSGAWHLNLMGDVIYTRRADDPDPQASYRAEQLSIDTGGRE